MIEANNNITQTDPGFNRQITDTVKAVSHRQSSSNKSAFTQKGMGSSEQLSFNRIESVNSSLNKTAAKIGETAAVLNKINNNVNEIKTELTKIVDSHPPLPDSSEERGKILTNVNQFQEKINQLADSAEKIKGSDTSVGMESGILSVKLDENHHPYTIRSFMAEDIQKYIKPVTSRSPDSQVYESLQNIGELAQELEKTQVRLKNEVDQLINTKILSKPLPGFKDIKIDENMLAQKSADIGYQLKNKVNDGIAVKQHDKLLELLA